MVARVDIDENRLRHMIEVERLQQRKVADIFGVHTVTIERRCRKLGLKTQRTGPRSGDQHPEWKGGKRVDADGYVVVYCPEHPNARKQKTMLEHRLVMENHIGRFLRPEEVVHHVNGNKQDNRIENLMLFSKNSSHLRFELTGDSVHALSCLCKMRRTCILASLAGGDPLPLPKSPRSRDKACKHVRLACEQLGIQRPWWFDQPSDSKK